MSQAPHAQSSRTDAPKPKGPGTPVPPRSATTPSRETAHRPLRDESPAEIEDHIRRTRGDMDQTLDELSEKLDPSYLAERLWSAVRSELPDLRSSSETFGAVGRSIGRSVREHPVPAALVGLGAAWLISEQVARNSGGSHHHDHHDHRDHHDHLHDDFDEPFSSDSKGDAGRRVVRGAKDAAQSVKSAAGDAADSLREGVSRSAHAVSATAHEAGDRVSNITSKAATGVQEGAREAAYATADAYDARPVLFGLAAAAAGFAAAVAIPDSRAERRAFGSTATRWRREAAERTAQFAESKAEQARDAVADAAENVGQQLESKADELADRAKPANQSETTSQSQTAGQSKTASQGGSFGQASSDQGSVGGKSSSTGSTDGSTTGSTEGSLTGQPQKKTSSQQPW